MRIMGLMGLMAFALSAGAQSNFVFIPFGHPSSTPWWTNTSIPDEVTNWWAWKAVNENFQRASNALVATWNMATNNNRVISSNSWLAVPITLTFGDEFYTASNGVPYVIWVDASYVWHTNFVGGSGGGGTVTLSGDATGSGSGSITVTATNIQPPQAGSVGQPLVKTATGVGFGNIASNAVTGLADAQTNAALNSMRTPAIVSNLVSIAAGATNVLGWVTNLAGVDFVYPNILVTNTGWWTTNGPLMLFSYDGTNYTAGLASLVTNVAVQLAWYSGSMPSNPPTMQIPLPGVVSNVVAWKLVRPDLFGKTNASWGQVVLAQDPLQPQAVATKNYVDNLFTFTSWWSAQNDVNLNSYSLNMSSTWQQAVDSLTNSTSYHLRFLGQDTLKVLALQPVSISNASCILTNATNIFVRVPTNGLSGAPRLELSHYVIPPVWSMLTNLPTISGTNYTFVFRQPYTDLGFLLAVVPSPTPPAVQLSGVLDLYPFTTGVTTNLLALRIWNSNNVALYTRGTNGADKLLLSFP